MADKKCNHVWVKKEDPFRLECELCGKAFDAKDPDCIFHFGKEWAEDMAEAMAKTMFK